jgi:hypothetical protein
MTLPISDKATQAIIAYEISSPAYYMAHLQHPVWPGGQSGATIGIGYDLGQQSAEQVRADWGAYLDEGTIELLILTCGICGPDAQAAAESVSSVVIPYEAASAVFTASTLPRYIDHTVASLPGCEILSPDCLGALVSISYNRGWGGWDSSLDRYREMAAIRADITAQSLTDIPTQIRAMKRLWPASPGLRNRREAEAVLFEQGLAASS